ncbi:MAG TPA: alcohol dehydrogenase, partial [Firmicutes bacterium]|nr:alcohol dehydrogenase [Bacillota bacterium]
MLDYSFHMPTKIKWGPEAVLKNANLLQQYGRKVAIITGTTSAAKSGALSDIMEAVTTNGQIYQVFSGVLTDPSIENVVEMAVNVKRYAPDFLVAIGGGSVIDATKAIAILLTGGIKEETLWQPITYSPMAVVAIPTTAG